MRDRVENTTAHWGALAVRDRPSPGGSYRLDDLFSGDLEQLKPPVIDTLYERLAASSSVRHESFYLSFWKAWWLTNRASLGF